MKKINTPNIQTILFHILSVLSVSSTQCMQLEKQTINTQNYPKNLHLDKPLIEKLITINTKNEFHRPFVCTRKKRLELLQELIHQGAQVSFENNDAHRTLWISRQEPNIYLDALYDEFSAFFSQKKFKTQRAFSQQPTTYTHTLWCNNSFLYIILTKPVTIEAEYILGQFLCDYRKSGLKKLVSYEEISDDEDTNNVLTTLPETTQDLLTNMLF